MSTQQPDEVSEPAPIHHALDHLTIVTVELQRVQRRAQHGDMIPPEELAGILGAITGHLHDLAEALIAIRNESETAPSPRRGRRRSTAGGEAARGA